MELTVPIVNIMRTGRVDTEYESRINSLDFHRTTDLLVTAADDDSIKLYSLETGLSHKTLHSKKYGISHVNFTHHPSAIVFASNKGNDHALRYLSVHDNKFIRYLNGHTGRVTSVSVCPKSDLVMSTSQDRTMRLWDLRVTHCQGLLEVPSGVPTAAYDLQGLVFCVGLDSGLIKLYDVRSFDKGPFSTFVVSDEANGTASFSSLKFSPDGKMLAAVVNHNIYQLDAYKGLLQQRYSSGIPEGATPLEVSFSPDNKFLLSGHQDKSIRVWAADSGREVCQWPIAHTMAPVCLKWAPKRLLVASACTLLNLWIPSVTELKQMNLVT